MNVGRRFALPLLLAVLACHHAGTEPPAKNQPTPCVRLPPPPVDVLGDGTCSRPCRADPPSTSHCVAGRCQTKLVQSGVGVGSMAVDAQGIYWGGNGGAVVNQLPLSGGTPAAIGIPEIRSYNGGINSLAARDGLVYVGFSGGIVAFPNMGGPQSTFLDAGAGPSTVDGLQLMALGQSEAYYLSKTRGPGDYTMISGIVTKVSIHGGTPTTLYVPPVTQFQQSDPSAIIPLPMRMAADSQNIYWSESVYGRETSPIRRVPIAGGDMSTLATVRAPWTSIATDETGVYWTDAGDGTVMKASPDGSIITLATGQTHPSLVLSDGRTVYWADDSCAGETTGAILKLDATGGTPEVIASGISVNNDGAFTIEGDSLYWNSKDGIMRISPR